MNKNDASQYLPLVQALCDGKTIQSNTSGEWKDIDEPGFANPPTMYRIKPEPREIWVVIGSDSDGYHLASPDKEIANQTAKRSGSCEVRRYREVLE